MSLVVVEDRGAVRHVILNRPEKRNALSAALIEELGAALRAAAADDAVRVVVLRGEGAMFSSGMDIADLGALAAAPQRLPELRAGDPGDLEPLRGHGQADDRPAARRLPRRRRRARAGLRPARHGGRRDHRPRRDAGRADPRRRRLLAAAGARRPRPRQGADHGLQAHRRDGGRADRPRQPGGPRRRARRGDRSSSPTSCWPAPRSPSAWPRACSTPPGARRWRRRSSRRSPPSSCAPRARISARAPQAFAQRRTPQFSGS